MVKYATTPMVSMLKHPEPVADINPSFRVSMPGSTTRSRPRAAILKTVKIDP